MTHLSASLRPHGWTAFCEQELCLSLCLGHLAGRCSYIPSCPWGSAAPIPMHTHTATPEWVHGPGAGLVGFPPARPPPLTTWGRRELTTITNSSSNLYFSKNKKIFLMFILHVQAGYTHSIVTETLQGLSFLSPVYRQDSKGRRGHVSSLSSRGGAARQEHVGGQGSNSGVICLLQSVPIPLLLLKRERIKYKPSHSQYSLLKSKTKASNPHSFPTSH